MVHAELRDPDSHLRDAISNGWVCRPIHLENRRFGGRRLLLVEHELQFQRDWIPGWWDGIMTLPGCERCDVALSPGLEILSLVQEVDIKVEVLPNMLEAGGVRPHAKRELAASLDRLLLFLGCS